MKLKAYLLIVICFLFAGAPVVLAKTSSGDGGRYQFRLSETHKEGICKYSSPSLNITLSSPKPELFRNVKNIFIVGDVSSSLGDDLTAEDLKTLAGCVTYQHIKHNDNDTPPYIPVYISGDNNGFVDIPGVGVADEWKKDAHDKGNLFIYLRGDFVKGNFKEKVARLDVRFHRYGMDTAAYAWGFSPQCVQVFPVEENLDSFQKRLTRAAEACLRNPYFTGLRASDKE